MLYGPENSFGHNKQNVTHIGFCRLRIMYTMDSNIMAMQDMVTFYQVGYYHKPKNTS